MEIQWYPGHMAKAKRELKAILPLLDIIIEVTDARIPKSSRNPDLISLTKNKPRLLLMIPYPSIHPAPCFCSLRCPT